MSSISVQVANEDTGANGEQAARPPSTRFRFTGGNYRRYALYLFLTFVLVALIGVLIYEAVDKQCGGGSVMAIGFLSKILRKCGQTQPTPNIVLPPPPPPPKDVIRPPPPPPKDVITPPPPPPKDVITPPPPPPKDVKPSISAPLYGICYSSFRDIGKCPTAEEVDHDIEVLKHYSTRVRTYGTSCPVETDKLLNQSTLDPNFSLFLGVWLDGNNQQDDEQIEALLKQLDAHPFANLYGISVGNEVLLRGSLSEDRLIERIRHVRREVRALGEKHDSDALRQVPILTVETVVPYLQGSQLASEVDIVAVNIHPFFSRPNLANTDDFAGQALADFLGAYNVVKLAADQYGKEVVVAEVGWPTATNGYEMNQGSVQLAKTFLDAFMERAETQGMKYFWFELYDAKWKQAMFWGQPATFSEFNLGLVRNDFNTSKGLLDVDHD